MSEKEIDKLIRYGLTVIVVYYVVGMFIHILIIGVVGLVVIRIYLENRR